jgi:hypothetical protein
MGLSRPKEGLAYIEQLTQTAPSPPVVTNEADVSVLYEETAAVPAKGEGGAVKENVIGTVVAPITTYRPSPGKILFKDDELGDTVTKVYTGEEIRPDVTVHLDDVLNTQLNEDEYTLTYADNIKCGAGTVKATGVYPLDDSDENSISIAFLIVPEKGNIEKITAGEESITIDVQDQKDSGISGYGVQYREEGVSDWQYEKFGADSASLVIKGLTAGKSYEVRACAYIDILNANGEEELNGLHSGELSEPVISAEVKKAEKKTEETENKPDNKNEKKTEKKANTLTVKGKTVKVKYKKLKNKSQKISRAKAINVKNAEGKVTYKLVNVKKLKASKAKKKAAKSKKTRSTKKQPAFKVSSKGKIIVRKGLGKGTYKLKIKVTAAGNSGYEKGAKNAAVTIKIK